MKKISIIISVYNEEKVLESFFYAFNKISEQIKWDYELIFVDDGSTDASFNLLYGYSKENKKSKVLSFSRNFGHEAAMIAGIDVASGDGIICMDADLQHPLECIPQIIERFEAGYDVVTMVRLDNQSAGFIKNKTSKLFYKLLNRLSYQNEFEENVSDFFGISKRVAQILRKNFREKNRFLRGYVQSVGYKKTSIEYRAAERAGGSSHYSISKLFSYSLSTIALFSNSPLKLGMAVGCGSALLGFIVLIYTLFTYKKGAPTGYATIVILICFLFAILFFVVGIIGQYIAVLFAEIKDRPIYLIDKKINFDEENNSKD